MMRSSKNGKGQEPHRAHDALDLGRARTEAADRADDEPLLRDDAGNKTGTSHPRPFARAAAAANLPKNVIA